MVVDLQKSLLVASWPPHEGALAGAAAGKGQAPQGATAACASKVQGFLQPCFLFFFFSPLLLCFSYCFLLLCSPSGTPATDCPEGAAATVAGLTGVISARAGATASTSGARAAATPAAALPAGPSGLWVFRDSVAAQDGMAPQRQLQKHGVLDRMSAQA